MFHFRVCFIMIPFFILSIFDHVHKCLFFPKIVDSVSAILALCCTVLLIKIHEW